MKLFYKNNSVTSKANWVLDAFAKHDPYAKKCYQEETPLELGVMWGLGSYNFSLAKKYSESTTPWLFTDMPYWNRWNGSNRDTCYWRVIPNSLHCNWITDFPDDRFKKTNLTVKDWKTQGDYILVCPSSTTLEHFYLESDWTKKTVAKLKEVTDRPIKIRYKPRANGTSGPMVANVSFEEDCKNAWAVVTLASLAGVEAALLGTPVFCSNVSVCKQIACTDLSQIENPVRPNRAEWLNTLAYYQYTEDEISKGIYTDIIKVK